MKKSMALFMIVTLLMPMVVIPEQSLAEEKKEVNHTITCEWRDNNTTLVVKGQGRLADSEWEKQIKKTHSKLKKLVISEGITSMGFGYIDQLADKIEEIVFPTGMKILENSVVSSKMHNLRKVTLPDTLKTIEEYAFVIDECTKLSSLRIPDSVTYIGDNFSDGSPYLKKITLPKSLQKCDEKFKFCPSLKTVVNRSSLTIPLDDCKKKKTWYVNGKKKNKVPAGKTAKAKGKKYKIKYKLRGGKAKCKLPKSYRYGSVTKFSKKKIKKKGYYFLTWDVPTANQGEKNNFCVLDPKTSGTLTVKPVWIKYTVKNVKGRKIKVYVNDKGASMRADCYEVRYSTHKDMKDAVYEEGKHLIGQRSKSKSTIIKNLKKGKKYYIQIAWLLSGDWDIGPWLGKKCVKVKK